MNPGSTSLYKPRMSSSRVVSRRWLVAGGVVVILFVLVVVGLAVVYPKVAARMIRTRADRGLARSRGRARHLGEGTARR